MPKISTMATPAVETLLLRPATLEELEKALDSHRLQGFMASGHWWTFRRNGATRRWIKTPDKFALPAKAGIRTYVTLDKSALNSPYLRILSKPLFEDEP
jgi:hypothetical protein